MQQSTQPRGARGGAGMSDWKPTHEIEHGGRRVLVMLDDSGSIRPGYGPLYTREEWESTTQADYEVDNRGRVTFQGHEFAGSAWRI